MPKVYLLVIEQAWYHSDLAPHRGIHMLYPSRE
jgi:hypothetical protein